MTVECDRGPVRWRPILRWYQIHANRVPLYFYPLPGVGDRMVECIALLVYSQVLVLDVLMEQWLRDAHVVAEHRGWVHKFDIADRYSQRVGHEVSIGAIDQALHRMRKNIRLALKESGLAGVPFVLIECQTGSGCYRIADCGLRIEREAPPAAVAC